MGATSKNLIITSFLAICFTGTASYASGYKTKIFIDDTVPTQDTVASRLVYKVKEGIRKSSGMELVTSKAKSDMTMIVVSTPNGSVASSLAWTWLMTAEPKNLDRFLSSSVQYCGYQRVDVCAEGIVADTDKEKDKWDWVFSSPRITP